MIMKLRILIILLFLSTAVVNIQAMPAAGQGCEQPFSPCWCLSHPTACTNQGIPIDGELWALLAAGLILGIYYIKKTKTIQSS
jgi:hypothetical protein